MQPVAGRADAAPGPTVDVVLVSYNSADCLPASLATVRAFMGGRPYRLYVVDNASADESVRVVKDADREAVVIENAGNVGFAAAVNQAIRAGEGDLILLVNPDVLGATGDFAAVLDVLADDRVAAVATRMVDEAGELQRTCHLAPSPFTMLSENLALHERFPSWAAARAYRMLDWAMDDVRAVEDACGGFLVLRREAVEDVGMLDERFFLYCEETDWLQRARERSWRTVFTPEVEVVHAGGGSSEESGEALSAYLLESQYKYLRKRFGRTAEAATRFLFFKLDLLRSLGLLAPGSPRRASAAQAWRRLPLHLRGRR